MLTGNDEQKCWCYKGNITKKEQTHTDKTERERAYTNIPGTLVIIIPEQMMDLSSDEGLLVVTLSAYIHPSESMFVPEEKDNRQNKRKENVSRQMASERMATDYSTMAIATASSCRGGSLTLRSPNSWLYYKLK